MYVRTYIPPNLQCVVVGKILSDSGVFKTVKRVKRVLHLDVSTLWVECPDEELSSPDCVFKRS